VAKVLLSSHAKENERGKTMEPGSTRIEKMLNLTFASDPRLSRYPLPEVPADYRAKYPNQPYAVPFVVTPEIARDWLTYRVIRRDVTPKELIHAEFGPNRRFLPNALTGSTNKKGWVDTFLDGDIRVTHQGIAFSEDGFLLDGQHRLAACLLSGVPYEPLLSQLVPWNGFIAMDGGRARTADQFIDLPHPTLCAAAARYILPVIKQTEHHSYYDKTATKQEVLDLVYGWGLFAGPWINEIHTAARGSNIPNTALAATVMMALAAGGDKASEPVQEFLNGLRKNSSHRDFVTIGQNGEDPRYILRSLFGAARNVGKRTFNAAETYGNVGLIRRAMTVWMDQEEVKTLGRTPANRSLPEVWNADKVRAFHANHVN
jgi:hypothetical protein